MKQLASWRSAECLCHQINRYSRRIQEAPQAASRVAYLVFTRRCEALHLQYSGEVLTEVSHILTTVSEPHVQVITKLAPCKRVYWKARH